MSDWADGLLGIDGPDAGGYDWAGSDRGGYDLESAIGALSPEKQALQIETSDPNFTGADPTMAEQTPEEITAQLARMNPSAIAQLAAKFGINLGDTTSALSQLVKAIALVRNQGPNGANRQAAMSGLNALVDHGRQSPYSGANMIGTAPTPTYHSASNFIAQPPASTGPLNLIRTQNDKR